MVELLHPFTDGETETQADDEDPAWEMAVGPAPMSQAEGPNSPWETSALQRLLVSQAWVDQDAED